jgi:hypothetical protein
MPLASNQGQEYRPLELLFSGENGKVNEHLHAFLMNMN